MTIDTLWYTRCPVPTASGIAIQLGWIDAEFEPDGIVVRSLASSPDIQVRKAHYLLTRDDLFRHGGNTPPLVAASQGKDLRVIGLSWTDTSQPVLVLPESDIRTAADLRGKRLALPRRVNDPIDFWNGTVARTYDTVLRGAGLTLDDVELVDLPIEREFIEDAKPNTTQHGALWGAHANASIQRHEAIALVRGEVDAIASEAAIGASLAATLRLRVVADPGRDGDPTNNGVPLVLSVSGPLLDSYPELVTRWLARVLAAADWAAANEPEAKRVLAAEAGIAEDFVEDAYSADVHEQLGIQLDERAASALRSQADHLGRLGRLAGPVDVDALIDPAPLASARELLAAQPSAPDLNHERNQCAS